MTEVFSFLLGVGVLGAAGAFFIWSRSRFTVGKREILVVKRDGRFEQAISQPGVHWLHPAALSVERIQLPDSSHNITVKGKARDWTLEFVVHAFTEESIEASFEVRLHLETGDEGAEDFIIYELFEKVGNGAEATCRDLVSTISLGDLRTERRQLQTTLQHELKEQLELVDTRVHRVVISPFIKFSTEVEEALQNETQMMLDKRAEMARENHKNQTLVRSTETESQTRTHLAQIDARNIQRVGLTLGGNKVEAARYIILMRFLHELSRLDSEALKENIHKPYLELLREFMTDIDTITLEPDELTPTTPPPTAPN